VIRAHITWDYMGCGIAVSLVAHPPEGSFDVRPRILHFQRAEAGFVSQQWDEIPADGVVSEPTLRLDDDAARALLDGLTRHYQGAEDTRALRRDYDAERKRVDGLTATISQVALKLMEP
jgi:hypothetical protein